MHRVVSKSIHHSEKEGRRKEGRRRMEERGKTHK
jgi:hypothetical protein